MRMNQTFPLYELLYGTRKVCPPFCGSATPKNCAKIHNDPRNCLGSARALKLNRLERFNPPRINPKDPRRCSQKPSTSWSQPAPPSPPTPKTTLLTQVWILLQCSTPEHRAVDWRVAQSSCTTDLGLLLLPCTTNHTLRWWGPARGQKWSHRSGQLMRTMFGHTLLYFKDVRC